MSISAISSMSGYNVLGIYGNPSSIRPIKRVDEDTKQNNPLVTLTKKPEEEKMQNTLPATTSTSVSSFADTLKMEELQTSDDKDHQEMDTKLASSLNDAIGVMGFQNSLRMQLMGVGFQAFGAM